MRRLSLAFLAFVGLCLPISPVHAGSPAVRHKTGPTFTRGIVATLTRTGFVLRTRHGSYQVTVIGATSVTEKGKPGRVPIHSGDDVGVRGFVQGREIRAIYVHIYPRKAKPKPYTVEGIVTQVLPTAIVVRVSGHALTVIVTPQTAVRFGSQVSTRAAITAGSRIQARVVHQGQEIVAIRVHVYHVKTGGRHVVLRGSISAVVTGSITIRSGTRTTSVRTTPATRVYLGNRPSSSSVVRVGTEVTVYACCAGSTPIATSIHVRRASASHYPTVLLHGWVLSLAPGSIRLSTGTATLQVSVVPVTRYTVGTAPAHAVSVRVGDEISIRAARVNGRWQAVSVHVYSSSRRPHTLTGTVVSASPAGLVVLDRGKRYTVSLQSHPSISLSGHPVTAVSLRPGDQVRVTGRLTGPAMLTATRITAKRLLPRIQMVRGVVSGMSGTTLTVVDASGVPRQVRMTATTAIELHQRGASRSLLFPGVHVSVRGVIQHGVLVAGRIVLTLTARTVIARVLGTGRAYLVVQRGTSERIRVDLPAGVSVVDGSKRVTVGIGAYVRAAGYEVQSGEIRAVSVRVVHLAVSLSGTAVAGASSLSLQTTGGARYQLHLTKATQLSTGRETVTLTASTIPNGAHIHVEGTVDADGRVTVSLLTIRLTSVTLRGTVTAITDTTLTVTTPSGPGEVHLSSTVTYEQGSHALDLGGIVVGDDATVYGYDGGHGIVLARKILIHRRIIGIDGSIASLTSDGFVLTTADGPRAVILTGSTIFSNLAVTAVSVGLAVHVTGYGRGDGSILATRVRAGKKRLDTLAIQPITRRALPVNAGHGSSTVRRSHW